MILFFSNSTFRFLYKNLREIEIGCFYQKIIHRFFFLKDSTIFRYLKMTLKLRILRSLTRLFIILESLTRWLFSEKMLLSNRLDALVVWWPTQKILNALYSLYCSPFTLWCALQLSRANCLSLVALLLAPGVHITERTNSTNSNIRLVTYKGPKVIST